MLRGFLGGHRVESQVSKKDAERYSVDKLNEIIVNQDTERYGLQTV